jgi:hypothetical protein
MYCIVYFQAFGYVLSQKTKEFVFLLFLNCYANPAFFILIISYFNIFINNKIIRLMYSILFSVIGAPFIKVPPVEITVAKGKDLFSRKQFY